jgi:hypothetical protein
MTQPRSTYLRTQDSGSGHIASFFLTGRELPLLNLHSYIAGNNIFYTIEGRILPIADRQMRPDTKLRELMRCRITFPTAEKKTGRSRNL